VPNGTATLNFRSGLTVQGTVKTVEKRDGKVILISFLNCTVRDELGNVLFEPAWGTYDMAVGDKIVSVYCGAADKDSFEEIAPVSKTSTYHPEYDSEKKKYHELFRIVRYCRESHTSYDQLLEVWGKIRKNFREDWLCSTEILEILNHENIYPEMAREIRIYLEMKASSEPDLTKLIHDGFYLIKNPVTQLTN